MGRLRSVFFKVLDNAIYSLYKVPKGILSSWMIMKNKDACHIVICNHIGDFIITMGYLEEYKKRNENKDIVLYIEKKFESLLQFYPKSYEDVVLLKRKTLEHLLIIGRTNFGQSYLGKNKHLCVVNPADSFTSNFFQYPAKFPEITLVDCIKYGVMSLDQEAEFIPPKISSKRNNENFVRKILLCPHASVTEKVPLDFFIELAKIYLSTGYLVYTNVDRNEKEIEGTERLELPLDELAKWVDQNTYIVGLRSGLLDLLAYTESTVIAIYPTTSIYYNFFNVEMMPKTTAIMYQYMYDEQTIEKIQKIIN